ncbi:hypothetical protein ABIB25_004671 [Nakamurella sp. UYEF19]|uniref:hypothetical protein n=1 Tax=Nakamurella sp. UYEF19 TaxID=1756392 RepID=UPI0033998085
MTKPVDVDGAFRLLPLPASFDRSSVTVSGLLMLLVQGESVSALRRKAQEVTLWVGVGSGGGGLPKGLIVAYLRLAHGPMCLAGGMYGGPVPKPVPCNVGVVGELAAPHRGFTQEGVY